jgi:hypothetical protein
LSEKFIKSDHNHIEVQYPYNKNFNNFFTESANKNEVIKLINNLKYKRATGFDKLSVELIKSTNININYRTHSFIYIIKV